MIHRGRPGRASRGAARIAGLENESADAELLRVLDEDFAEARRRAGDWLVCGPGCSDCCYGPFPVTRLDVRRLRRGMRLLRDADPDRAGAVRRRAEEAVGLLAPGLPGDLSNGRLTQDDAVLDPFFELHAGLACPALDPSTQTCDLHPWRPVSCRTYGPPVRFGREEVPPCDLCFGGAPREAVDRCRIEPDRDGIEQALLARLGIAADEDWETLIAWALADAPADPRAGG